MTHEGTLEFLEIRMVHYSKVSEKELEECSRNLIGGILKEKGNVSINGKKDPKLYDYECVSIDKETNYGEELAHYFLGFDLR